MESARCKAFLAAAELGSLSKAAEKLNYTASGVSQLISALENEFGFPLLRRTSKGVFLTLEGEQMLPAVRAFLQQENRIYELAANINGLDIGEITIAAYSSIATHWLPKVIADFKKKYPNIHINLREGVRQEVLQYMDEGKADIGLLSDGDDIKYDWIPLAEDPMIAVLPKDHTFANADKFPLSQCVNERFIMPALGKDEDVVKMLSRYSITPEIVYSTNESFSAWAMVENGLGMSITNELLMHGWKCDVAKVPIYPPEKITLGMIIPSLKHASPAVKRFVNLAEGELKKIKQIGKGGDEK